MTQEPRSIPPPKLRSSWGKATLAIVLSKACIAVAIINAIAACRRPEIERTLVSTVIRSCGDSDALGQKSGPRQPTFGLQKETEAVGGAWRDPPHSSSAGAG